MKTFVVRVWTPAEPAGTEDQALRGVVEQVGSNCSTTFGDADELIAFLALEATATQPAASPGPAPDERSEP